MLLAASESAVTKKPRLRLTRRRSSSVRPFGFFHSSMSRCMFTSCGIQWLAQPARYLSHAHLYLNGTSWLTSVLPLMIRLSSAFTRLASKVASGPPRPDAASGAPDAGAAPTSSSSQVNMAFSFTVRVGGCASSPARALLARFAGIELGIAWTVETCLLHQVQADHLGQRQPADDGLADPGRNQVKIG